VFPPSQSGGRRAFFAPGKAGVIRQLSRQLIGLAVFGVCASVAAAASDPLGFYVGGAIGQGEVVANVPNPFVPNPSFVHVPVPTSDTFKEDHAAFKVMVGLRPIPLLGAELSYLDLGNPTGSLFGHPASASMKGASAFGILYLPIPVVDVFAKAGVARIQSIISGLAPNGIPDFVCAPGVPCGTSPFRQDRTNTTFAAGAGVQFRFDAWAVRAEYERFNAAGEIPHLLSFGLTWSF
jgi:opacity protein-like surface antigen